MTTFAIARRQTPLGDFLAPGLYASGAGHDVTIVETRAREAQESLGQSLTSVISYQEALLSEHVRTLADEWRAATLLMSSPSDTVSHPAYQAIVHLGPEVVPILLRDLQRDSDFWFAALTEITGENPIHPEQWGDMKAMADAWVRWGRQRNLIR